jgi:hypothetical protein
LLHLNVHAHSFSRNDVFVINGYKFIGATLWTDFEYPDCPDFFELRKKRISENGNFAELKMNDFKKISQKHHNKFFKIKYNDVLLWNVESKRFIFEELNKDDGYKNVVLTHFGIVKEALSDEHHDLKYAMYYVNDWEKELLNTVNPPAKVVAGHSHCVKHEKINDKFDLIMNCAGYKTKNPDDLVAEFKSDKLFLF